MPLYELVCIAAHQAQLSSLRALTTTTASLVLANGGVVRSVDHWGTRNLPQKMKRGDGSATTGTYWTMKFDANPPTVAALNARLKLDPRVLRWTTLKVGTTLSEITAPPEDPTVTYSRSLPGLAAAEAEETEDDAAYRALGLPGGR